MADVSTSERPDLSAQRQERRRARVRDDILEAAERVVALEGVEALSMRKLADSVDYSAGALYKYFASKEDLIKALKGVFFETLVTRLEAAMHGDAETVGPSFQRGLVTYVDVALERPHLFQAAFSGVVPGGENDGPMSEGPDDAKARCYMALRNAIERGMISGEVMSMDCDLAAMHAWAAIHGLASLMVHMPGFPKGGVYCPIETPKAATASHAAFIWRGLQAPGAH
jgi:AcrR family transcriptional regulator